MKKMLFPLVALLAFSTLCTSVSAPSVEYYASRFCGHANGCCSLFAEPLEPDSSPIAFGKGRIHIRGLAIVREDADYYWANTTDPNTRVWTYLTRMRVSWNNERLVVHMWKSDMVEGEFYDDEDWFVIANMAFSGWYREGITAPQHVWGGAVVAFFRCPYTGMLLGTVTLYVGTEHWLTFAWLGEPVEGIPPELVTHSFFHKVSVWPID